MNTIALIALGILVGQVPWLLAIRFIWKRKDKLEQLNKDVQLFDQVRTRQKQ